MNMSSENTESFLMVKRFTWLSNKNASIKAWSTIIVLGIFKNYKIKQLTKTKLLHLYLYYIYMYTLMKIFQFKNITFLKSNQNRPQSVIYICLFEKSG